MKIKPLLYAAALVAITAACAREEDPEGMHDISSESITINATIPEDLATKLDFAPSYTGGKPQSMALTWADGDKLRVYNHDDRSQYSDFTLASESIGQKIGSFSGTPVSASSYDVEVFSEDFDYSNQVQPSDGVTTSLKYLASVSDIADLSNIIFTDFSSILAITAKMPSAAIAAKIKSVDITASKDIFDGGNSLSITLTTPGSNDDILNLFATLPQGNQVITAGTTLLVKFNAPGETHDVYTRFITLGAQTLTNNKLNTININATQSETHAGLTSCDGTSMDKAYLIGDKYQMQAMHSLAAADATTFFKMVDDVDLEGVEWVSLNYESPYSKALYFDGNGHTVLHLTSDTSYSEYPSFAGVLNGTIRNVTFDSANITCGSKMGGVVAGYIGSDTKNFTGICTKVNVSNSTVNSENTAGTFAAYGENMGVISQCSVTNSSVESTAGRVGGFIGSVKKFSSVLNCYTEDITVTSGTYYAGGLIGQLDGAGTVSQCHASGSVTANHAKYARSGGLIGYLIKGSVENSYSECTVTTLGQWASGLVGQIKDGTVSECYSEGTVNSSNHYAGGLVGLVEANGTATVEKSYFNGTISLPTGGSGKAQAGGVIGLMDTGSSATISDCYTSGSWVGRRWFGGIVGGTGTGNDAYASSLTVTNCYTTFVFTGVGASGALIGANYMPSDDVTCSGFIAGWSSGALVSTGNAVTPSSYYLGTAVNINTKATEFNWSSTVWDLNKANPTLIWGSESAASDPEDPSWTDTPTLTLPGATTVEIVPGVQYIHFHGQWEDQWREINIIKTTLDEHNSMGIYYNYTDDNLLYLNQKCEQMDAVAGTNGPMKCCQFVRVDYVIQRAATASSEWIANCAFTIDDGNVVDIVKVKDNFDAAKLPNKTVGCAGPLLVWKGIIQDYKDGWLEDDTDQWLTTTHPRTAIGLSKDGKTVIQVAVDGRWTYTNTAKRATGMDCQQLARLMKGLGCYKAMNFDGGGGTAMWVYGQGNSDNIVNHPHNPAADGKYYWSPITLRPTGSAVYVKSNQK